LEPKTSLRDAKECCPQRRNVIAGGVDRGATYQCLLSQVHKDREFDDLRTIRIFDFSSLILANEFFAAHPEGLPRLAVKYLATGSSSDVLDAFR
jgi:hypothetical protein